MRVGSRAGCAFRAQQGQHGPCQLGFIVGGSHDGVGAVNAQTGTRDLLCGFRVTQVSNQNIEKIFVSLAPLQRSKPANPCAAIKIPAGPETAASPTIGLTAATVASVFLKRIPNAGDGKDRPNAGDRIARRDDHGAGGQDRFHYAGRRLGFCRPGRSAPT